MKKYFQSRFTNMIIRCILIIIILSLILSTINNYINPRSEQYIAIVNGEKINISTFQKMYLLEQKKQQKILGNDFFQRQYDKKFIQKIYDDVLSQLINNLLLEQYVKKLQLQISDAEIKKIIFQYPLFQKDQRFNQDLYFQYLASVNLNHYEYINMIKTKINTETVINTIIKNNFILNNEYNNIVNLLSEKRIIKTSIMTINASMNQKNISKIEAQDYFYKNKNDFYIPEKFKISFVKLNLNMFKTGCSNKEIYDVYLKNTQKYLTKEKKRYSIIQIKTQKEALLILSELHNRPENFSKIAQEKSIDPLSSKTSGDIGWLSDDITPDEIKKANLKKINQISNIIPFHNEFLILKLNAVIPTQQKKINEVSDIIEKEIKYKKALHLYNTLIDRISHLSKNNLNQMELILKENNILIEETDWFNKNSVPEKLNNPIIKEMIFNKKLLQHNQVPQSYFHFIRLKDDQTFLIKLKDFKKQKKQSFENVQKNIIYKLKIIKAIKETKQKAQEIINELKQGKNNLFQQSHLSFTSPKIVSRYDQNNLTSIIFSLPRPKQGEKKYTLYQDQNNNFIIISLEKVYNTNFALEEKNIIRQYLENNNTKVIFDALLKNLRDKSIIQYNFIENNQ